MRDDNDEDVPCDAIDRQKTRLELGLGAFTRENQRLVGNAQRNPNGGDINKGMSTKQNKHVVVGLA